MKKAFTALSVIIFISLIAVICNFALRAPSQTQKPSDMPTLSETPVSLPSAAPQTPSASSIPSPTPNKTSTPAEYEINYFAIPEAIKPKLTEADKAAYKATVEAYFNYEAEAEFKANDKIQNLKQLLELCCPVFYNDVEEASIKIDGNRILWEYSDSKPEHDKNIARLESSVNEYLNYARGADNDVARALLLYKLFCTKNHYDYPTEDYLKGKAPRPEKMRVRCIDILLDNSGICQCFARGYAFLLNQAGIEAFTACADGGLGHHEWTVVKFDGKWYYADPTWDVGGSKLYYFGMTSDRRAADGYKLENTKYFAGGDYPIADDFSIDDTRFKKIYTGNCSGYSYEIDTENNLVLVYKKDSAGNLYLYSPGTFDINAK